MNNKLTVLSLIDVLIVLLNIAAGRGNILPYWLFSLPNGNWVMGLTILIDILYILVRLQTLNGFRYLKNLTPFYIMMALMGYNAFNILIHGEFAKFVPVLETLGVEMVFAFILATLIMKMRKANCLKSQGIFSLSKGYLLLSFISIGGVFVSFMLLRMGFSSYEPINAEFMSANIESGATYVRSFFSVNSIGSILRVPFFQDFGMLCGLFHEPHILAYNVFPCLFLAMGLTHNRLIIQILLIVSATLIILFTGSTTNLLATAICLLVYFQTTIKRNFITNVLFISVIIGIIYAYVSLDDTLFTIVSGRLDADNHSQQYSISLLEFAFTPKTLMGTNFLSTQYVLKEQSREDVGYIPFVMNIMFILFYCKNIIQLLRSTDSLVYSVGMASLYYILHSAKIGMVMYSFPLIVLLIFLQATALTQNGRINTIEKNR